MLLALLVVVAVAETSTTSSSEKLKRHNEFVILEGHQVRDNYQSPLPYTYIKKEDLPDNFDWRSVDGVSYTTHSLNQVRGCVWDVFVGVAWCGV
jgi:hypothetical protein